MTFVTLAMMAFLCLFIPVALPVSAIRAVILLYFYTQQSRALVGVLALVGVADLYLKQGGTRDGW